MIAPVAEPKGFLTHDDTPGLLMQGKARGVA